MNRELIDFFERKILSNIFGPSQAKGLWRIRIIRFTGRMMMWDVGTFLVQKLLQWAGLVIRVDDSYVRQKIMGGCFVGRRRVGKPRVRWEDAVWKDDVHLLQIRNPKPAARKRQCGGRRSGRPWPEKRPTRHKRRNGTVEVTVWKFVCFRP